MTHRLYFLCAALILAAPIVAQEPRIEWRTLGPHTATAAIHATDDVVFFGSGLRVEGETVKGAPYIAEAVNETVQTLGDGNRIRRETRSKIFRDAEGRTRREETIGGLGPWGGGKSKEVIFINDIVSGDNWMLLPEEQTARKMNSVHTTNISEHTGDHDELDIDVTVDSVDEHVERHDKIHKQIRIVTRRTEGKRDQPEPSTEDLGERMIEGVKAQGTRITSTIPAGAIGNDLPLVTTIERWHSSALEIDVLVEHNDPRMGKVTYRLTGLQRVDPSPSLFAPPAGYEIVEGDNRFATPAFIRTERIHKRKERR